MRKQIGVITHATLSAYLRGLVVPSTDVSSLADGVATLESPVVAQHGSVCDSVAELGQQVRMLQDEVFSEVPSVALVNAKLDAMRGLFRCTCAQTQESVKEQVLNAKSYVDDQFQRVSKPADLQKFMG